MEKDIMMIKPTTIKYIYWYLYPNKNPVSFKP